MEVLLHYVAGALPAPVHSVRAEFPSAGLAGTLSSEPFECFGRLGLFAREQLNRRFLRQRGPGSSSAMMDDLYLIAPL